MSTILIGIAGGTGSGKTTLTRHLKEHFGPEVTVIGHDSYYKRQVGKTYEERTRVNYDHPDAFDTDLLIEHLKELKAGWPIQFLCGPQPDGRDGGNIPHKGHHCRGHSDFPEPDAAGYVRHQDFRGD